MEAPKNSQSTVMGDTATVDQPDVASFMVPDVARKQVNVSIGGTEPDPAGVKTPGNPAR